MRKTKSTLILAGGLLLSGMLIGASPAQAGMASPSMLSNTCAGCHGTNGNSAGPAMPIIAGLPAEHTKTMMKEFKSGDRPATIMDRVAKGYSDEEIDAIAKHFAKQKWVNAKSHANSRLAMKVDAKLAADGKKASKKCEKCHEDNGVAQVDDVPRLAGQWLDYLVFKMQDLKHGVNGKDVPQAKKMKKQVDEKSIKELEAMAHFYASQK